jgi:hypothetical protein
MKANPYCECGEEQGSPSCQDAHCVRCCGVFGSEARDYDALLGGLVHAEGCSRCAACGRPMPDADLNRDRTCGCDDDWDF